MSTNLYDILHVTREAPPEEIRKAYRAAALKTHPDRLPPGSTQEQKQAAEEQFRKVNNAYEILKDAQKRREYDLHGVWPPPREENARPAADSYYNNPRSHRRRSEYSHHDPFDNFFRPFHFTDPFEMFDSVFNDQHQRHRHRHHPNRRRTTFDQGGFDDHFSGPQRMHSDMQHLMSSMERNMLSGFGSFGMGMGMGASPMRSSFPGFPSIVIDTGSTSGRRGGGWASESTMSQTINGVTHTIRKRRDWDGNEHVTRIYPDGRTVVTLNGVEQHDHANISPPPVVNNNHYLTSPPPPYSASNYPPPTDRPVIPNGSFHGGAYDNEGAIPSPTEHKSSSKRWWGRG